jgi:enoyl-CoA hydratase/carnithine racemase
MDLSSFSFLRVEVRDGVAFATMTHPDYDHEEREEWTRLIAGVDEDDDINVLLITGWGNPKRGRKPGDFDDFDAFKYYDRAVKQPVKALLDLDKPVVMAVDGNPGVLTIPLSGDIVVVERQLTFSDNHVLIGTASATQPFLWPMNSSLMAAKRYILTGETFTAEEGLKMGLFTEVVDTGKALERASEYANHIAGLRSTTVQATKQNLNQWLRMAFTPVYDRGLALEFMTFPTDFQSRYRSGAVPAPEEKTN